MNRIFHYCILALVGFEVFAQPPSKMLLPTIGHGFELKYSKVNYSSCQIRQEPRLTAHENGEQMPDDVAPIRVKISLKPNIPNYVRDKEGWSREPGTIQIIPLSDSSVPEFSGAYPEISKSAARINEILKNGVVHAKINADLPDWNFNDVGQTIHSKLKIIKTPWCSGIQYITQYIQEAIQLDNDGRLLYNFQGISLDQKYYISIHLPIANNALPFEAPNLPELPQNKIDAYYIHAEKRLSSRANETFFSAIGNIIDIIFSIHPVK